MKVVLEGKTITRHMNVNDGSDWLSLLKHVSAHKIHVLTFIDDCQSKHTHRDTFSFSLLYIV